VDDAGASVDAVAVAATSTLAATTGSLAFSGLAASVATADGSLLDCADEESGKRTFRLFSENFFKSSVFFCRSESCCRRKASLPYIFFFFLKKKRKKS